MDAQRLRLSEKIVAFQDGDRSALRGIVDLLRGPLLRLAGRILRDPITAEDIFMECMARLIPLLEDFEPVESFAAYARRAVRNACVDEQRRRSSRDSLRALRDTARSEQRAPEGAPKLVERLASGEPDPEHALVEEQRALAVRVAVSSLKPPRRTIVQRFYDGGQTYDEIATELELSVSSVKRHLGAARLLLAARLREHSGDPHAR